MNSSKTDKLTTISLSVFQLNGQLIEWGNRFAEPHGLTSARWQVLGAISLMAARGEKTPLSMTLMGGPVDGRSSPTAVNNVESIATVPPIIANVPAPMLISATRRTVSLG